MCLYLFSRSSLEALSKQPQSLEQLADALTLHKRLTEGKARMAVRFDPLREKYSLLDRFGVQVPDEQLDLLDRLDSEWARFQVTSAYRVCETHIS